MTPRATKQRKVLGVVATVTVLISGVGVADATTSYAQDRQGGGCLVLRDGKNIKYVTERRVTRDVDDDVYQINEMLYELFEVVDETPGDVVAFPLPSSRASLSKVDLQTELDAIDSGVNELAERRNSDDGISDSDLETLEDRIDAAGTQLDFMLDQIDARRMYTRESDIDRCMDSQSKSPSSTSSTSSSSKPKATSKSESTSNPEETSETKTTSAPKATSQTNASTKRAVKRVSDGAWGGYIAQGSSYSAITGTWVEPAVSCDGVRGDAVIGAWVGFGGIDDDPDSMIEQTGTDVECRDGEAFRVAWYQMFPRPSQYLDVDEYPISEGDVMTASVDADGTQFTLTLTNVSRTHEGWRFTTEATGNQPSTDSAEWVIEAPTNGAGDHALVPEFSDYKFTNCTTVVDGETFTAAELPGLLSNLVDDEGRPKATVGAFGTDGKSFSVRYKP